MTEYLNSGNLSALLMRNYRESDPIRELSNWQLALDCLDLD